MRINHNIAALNTYRQLSVNNNSSQKAIEKLSSGLRINRAGDDAAGLAISEKMRSQIRGLEMASRNAQDGISLIQTAEGALNETQAILQRMRELAVQAKNGTNTDDDRKALNEEYKELIAEITRIGEETEFNSLKVLNGSLSGAGGTGGTGGTGSPSIEYNSDDLLSGGIESISISGEPEAGIYTLSFTPGESGNPDQLTITFGGTSYNKNVTVPTDSGTAQVQFDELGITVTVNAGLTNAITGTTFEVIAATGGGGEGGDEGGGLILQIGANNGQEMVISIGDMQAESLGINDTSIDTVDDAEEALTAIDNALQDVSAQRSKLGAYQNRLEHTINNLSTAAENLTAAESRIRDVDMAQEMMEFTKNSILLQASQAMLAQANQVPQGVLQLLR
jgi:flagellin